MLFFPQEQEEDQEDDTPPTAVEDWMLICQHEAEFSHSDGDKGSAHDWSQAAKEYPNLKEMPSFIAQQRQQHETQPAEITADPAHLQGKQLHAYNIVREHLEGNGVEGPLRMIVSGTAGTGKSYLINCLKLLLGDRLDVTAPTGAAAFNVHGNTLHSLLSLPVKGESKDLEGKQLQTLQKLLEGVKYLIVDEMSMVGRKMFGQVDRRLRQMFPHR